MDNKEVRLRLMEVFIPTASRLDVADPERLVEKCKILESYVEGPTPEPVTPKPVKKVATKRRPAKASDGN